MIQQQQNTNWHEKSQDWLDYATKNMIEQSAWGIFSDKSPKWILEKGKRNWNQMLLLENFPIQTCLIESLSTTNILHKIVNSVKTYSKSSDPNLVKGKLVLEQLWISHLFLQITNWMFWLVQNHKENTEPFKVLKPHEYIVEENSCNSKASIKCEWKPHVLSHP